MVVAPMRIHPKLKTGSYLQFKMNFLKFPLISQAAAYHLSMKSRLHRILNRVVCGINLLGCPNYSSEMERRIIDILDVGIIVPSTSEMAIPVV
jgi:hypothetical protein